MDSASLLGIIRFSACWRLCRARHNRHTYAVRVLNKWVQEGRDLTTALPHLAIYMGHEGLKASQHYLRLTVVMFPELIRTVENEYGWVIPEAYHE